MAPELSCTPGPPSLTSRPHSPARFPRVTPENNSLHLVSKSAPRKPRQEYSVLPPRDFLQGHRCNPSHPGTLLQAEQQAKEDSSTSPTPSQSGTTSNGSFPQRKAGKAVSMGTPLPTAHVHPQGHSCAVPKGGRADKLASTLCHLTLRKAPKACKMKNLRLTQAT